MTVDGGEGLAEPFLCLAVELADGAAELGHRLLDICALCVELGMFLGESRQLLLGIQIDAAEPVALRLEAREPALDVGLRWERGVGREACPRQALLGAAL